MIRLKCSVLLFVFLIGCSSDGGNGNAEEPDKKPVGTNEAPSIPLLIYPSDNLVCIENELEFEWNAAADSDGDPITYFVDVAYDGNFENMVNETSTSDLSSVMVLEKGETLFWRVRASDNNNNYSGYSDTWKFYTEAETEPNRLPTQPTLANPNIGTLVDESSIDLIWNTTDEDGDTLSYDLYFGTDENPPLFDEGLESDTYSISVEPGKVYYWRVVSKDGRGGVSIGPIWDFATND
ncbi:hypothetical protein [Flagellimonas sp.]|uniref:hypothetical protein n=1 Tax=Flagellimonas sp. TaxID=2058762 RepID=UPI003B523E62